MSSLLTRIIAVSLVVVSAGVGALGCGTDPEEACEIRCTKSAECNTAQSKESCLTVCKEQIKDEAYGDAIVESADCYEESTCDEIASQVCSPQDL